MNFLQLKDDSRKKVNYQEQVALAQRLDDYAEKGMDLTDSASESSGIWSQEIKARANSQTLKSLFFTESWTFILTDLIANKISSQPLEIVSLEVEDGKETFQPNAEHPLNLIIEQPNPWQDYHSWMYNTVVEDTQMGNAIIWWSKQAGQLITLPADNIDIQFNTKREIDFYQMSTLEEMSGDNQAAMRFKPDEIIHVRRPNPNSLLWGLSPYVPGGASLLFNRYSQDYLNAFYLKQALPGMALALDRHVNEDVALRQLRSFEVAHSGRKNMRRTLILPKGVSAQALTHSLADQKLTEMIDKNRETIMGLLKVPKHELSLQEAGSLGSEEHKIALRNFWEATLIPITRRIEGSLNKFFAKELGENNLFRFNLDNVEALKDDLKKKAETAQAMLQAGLSVNEVRTNIWEVDGSSAPGADDPYILVQSSSPVAQPQTFTLPTKHIEAPSKKINPAQADEFRNLVQKQLQDQEAGTIATYSSSLIEILMEMVGKGIEVIDAEDAKTKGLKALPAKRILAKKIEQALDDLEEQWFEENVNFLSSSVDVGYDLELQLVFDQQNQSEIAALRARDEEKRRVTLEARALDSFAEVSKTTTEKIMREVTKASDDGLSIDDLIGNILDTVADPEITARRAETIARTETLTAVSIGQAAAVENAKEVIPGLQKVWLTVGDNRVRSSHSGLDGDIVDADAKFSNGLRHPRDIKANDPSEVINCRCTLMLITPDNANTPFEIDQ